MKQHHSANWRIVLPLLMASAHAGIAAADWTGSGQLGIVSAHGNTSNQSANAKIDAKGEYERWKHLFGFNMLYGENDDVTSANRWDVQGESDYKLTDKLFWFAGLRYEDDKFGAFSYQATVNSGLGYQFIDDDRTKLSVQVGAGYKRSRPQTLVKDDNNEVIERIDGDDAGRGVVTGGASFEHALTANTKILNKFLVEAASDNTFLQNNLSLQVSMSDRLALSVGYELRENTSPPADQHRLDSLTTLNLVYKVQ